ncbi:MAG: hypothetical protein ABR616_18170 [Dermatophilaceae bacterium]|nr:hypothetical protein [Intrasporangiaceae bacterium]
MGTPGSGWAYAETGDGRSGPEVSFGSEMERVPVLGDGFPGVSAVVAVTWSVRAAAVSTLSTGDPPAPPSSSR